MHYYAIINEEYTVMEVTSSNTTINDDWYIEITEEQYNDEGFIGAFYDQDKNEFVGGVMWLGTTNEVRYDETYRTLTGKLNEMDEEIATHTHTGYVSSDDLQALEDVIDTKADATHTHTEYSPVSHTHTEYATQVALDTLGEEIDGKANASHSHSNYAEVGHNHDSDYADINHNHDNAYSPVTHNHNSDYSAIDHSHSNYATVDSVSALSTTVSGKADATHQHNDIYYTEDEIDTKLATKSDSTHNHSGVYDVSGAAASALSSANTYTDSKINLLVGEGASTTLDTIGEISAAIEDNQDMINTLNSAIGNKANANDLTSHTGNTTIHVTETEKNSWNAKSNFSGNYNDLTNKPSIPSISGLATVTYVDSQIDAIVIPDALSDLTTDSTHRTVTDAEKSAWNAKSNFSGSYNDLTDKPTIPSVTGLATETYVDEAVATKANATHSHTISNVSGLQSALDNKSAVGHTHGDIYYTETEVNSLLSGKAATSHGIHVNYSTTAPVMDGTASVGSATTVARSDHKHPTDTSRASQTDLANLTTIVNGKATSSHTHTIANINNLQTQLDGKASSSHNHNGVYANASHSHTASAVGAVATTDVATVSEVESYLGI